MRLPFRRFCETAEKIQSFVRLFLWMGLSARRGRWAAWAFIQLRSSVLGPPAWTPSLPTRPIPTIMYYHVSFAPCIPLTLERQASLSCWCFWTARLMASTTLVDTYLLLGCLDAIYPPLPREEAFTHNYVWFFFFWDVNAALSFIFPLRIPIFLTCKSPPRMLPGPWGLP